MGMMGWIRAGSRDHATVGGPDETLNARPEDVVLRTFRKRS